MRNLNAKQKKMLTKMVEQGFTSTRDMSEEQYDEIAEVNFHETFWCNADRFMMDLIMLALKRLRLILIYKRFLRNLE